MAFSVSRSIFWSPPKFFEARAFITCILLMHSTFRLFMWFFHDSLGLNVRPNIFIDSVRTSSHPFKNSLVFASSPFFDFLMIIDWDLAAENLNPDSMHHNHRLFRFCWIIFMVVSKFRPEHIKVKSSAKRNFFTETLSLEATSLIAIKKNVTLITEP